MKLPFYCTDDDRLLAHYFSPKENKTKEKKLKKIKIYIYILYSLPSKNYLFKGEPYMLPLKR